MKLRSPSVPLLWLACLLLICCSTVALPSVPDSERHLASAQNFDRVFEVSFAEVLRAGRVEAVLKVLPAENVALPAGAAAYDVKQRETGLVAKGLLLERLVRPADARKCYTAAGSGAAAWHLSRLGDHAPLLKAVASPERFGELTRLLAAAIMDLHPPLRTATQEHFAKVLAAVDSPALRSLSLAGGRELSAEAEKIRAAGANLRASAEAMLRRRWLHEDGDERLSGAIFSLERAGLLGEVMASLEAEMKRDPANVVIPYNLFTGLRGSQNRSLEHRDRWVRFAEYVRSQGAEPEEAGMALAQYHRMMGRQREAALLYVEVLEGAPRRPLSPAAMTDMVRMLAEEKLAARAAAIKLRYFQDDVAGVPIPGGNDRNSPEEGAFALAELMAENPAERELAGRLAVATLNHTQGWIHVRSWWQDAASKAPLVRRMGAGRELAQLFIRRLAPLPEDEKLQPRLTADGRERRFLDQMGSGFWEVMPRGLAGADGFVGILLVQFVHWEGLLPELEARLSAALTGPDAARARVLLLVCGSVARPEKAKELRELIAPVSRGGGEDVAARLPGMSALDELRTLTGRSLRLPAAEVPPADVRRLLSAGMEEAQKAGDPQMPRDILTLAAAQQRQQWQSGKRETPPAFTRCALRMMEQKMAGEAQRFFDEAAAALCPAGQPVRLEMCEAAALLLRGALHHKLTPLAERLHSEGRAWLTAVLPREAGDFRAEHAALLAEWAELSWQMKQTDIVRADAARLRAIPPPVMAGTGSALQILEARLKYADGIREPVVATWLTPAEGGRQRLNWHSQCVPVLSAGGDAPDRPLLAWPGTDSARADGETALMVSDDGSAWRDLFKLPGARMTSRLEVKEGSFARLELRREGRVFSGIPWRLTGSRVAARPGLTLETAEPGGSGFRLAETKLKWHSTGGDYNPGAYAQSATIPFTGEGTWSLATHTLTCFAGERFRFSGWLRFKGPLSDNIRLTVEMDDQPGAPLLIRDVPKAEDTWIFLPPADFPEDAAGMPGDGLLRIRLQFALLPEDKRAVAEVQISTCDWCLQPLERKQP